MDDSRLDLRGLKCPLPALFARRALSRAKPGTVIEVLVDDPMALIDVPHMCRTEGYEFLETTREGSCTLLRLRRSPEQSTDQCGGGGGTNGDK